MSQGVEKRGWFSRNWKWVVPVGCLGTIVLFVAFIAAVLMAVMGAIRSSDAYELALSEARQHPAVVEALGEPIEVGWLMSGNISVNGASGEADLSIPLEGPKGSGTLYVVADKVAGQWDFERIEVEIDATMERVSLLNDASRGDP